MGQCRIAACSDKYWQQVSLIGAAMPGELYVRLTLAALHMLFEDPFNMTPPMELLRVSGEPTLDSLSCDASLRYFMLGSVHRWTSACVRIEQSDWTRIVCKTCPSADTDIGPWSIRMDRFDSPAIGRRAIAHIERAGFFGIPGVVDDPGGFDLSFHLIEAFVDGRYHKVSRDHVPKGLDDCIRLLMDLAQISTEIES